ncbi:MAG TPA: hypothetical protein VIY26_08625 [Acidimicrobiales bacterium]
MRQRRLGSLGIVTALVLLGALAASCSSTTPTHAASSVTTSSRPPKTVTPVTLGPKNVVLGADGLGVVGVGSPQANAVAAMGGYLGPPTKTTAGNCPGTTEVEWGDLSLEFTSGQLTGYRYLRGGLAAVGTDAHPGGPGEPLLKTGTGATLGMPRRGVQPLYPAADLSGLGGGSIVVPGTTGSDRLVLEFFASTPSTPLTEIKGGTPCGDF